MVFLWFYCQNPVLEILNLWEKWINIKLSGVGITPPALSTPLFIHFDLWFSYGSIGRILIVTYQTFASCRAKQQYFNIIDFFSSYF